MGFRLPPNYRQTPFPQNFQPELWRAMIYGSPNRQSFRWWQATIDPTYDRRTGESNKTSEHYKWDHTEQNCGQYRALIADVRAIKKWLPQGEFQSGDIGMVFMPDEVDIGDHDWIQPLGLCAAPAGRPTNARTLQNKEPLVRGLSQVAATGTVSASGSAITGVGTAFLSTFQAGDILLCVNEGLRVASVTDNTHLTVEAAPSPLWNGNTFAKAVDLLLYYPVSEIVAIADASNTYAPGTDFVLGVDGRTIQWQSLHSPSYNTPYSVVYRYLPLYEVIPDMGVGGFPVGGVPQPVGHTLRLVRPDTYRGDILLIAP
jgi:hypothetical protein